MSVMRVPWCSPCLDGITQTALERVPSLRRWDHRVGDSASPSPERSHESQTVTEPWAAAGLAPTQSSQGQGWAFTPFMEILAAHMTDTLMITRLPKTPLSLLTRHRLAQHELGKKGEDAGLRGPEFKLKEVLWARWPTRPGRKPPSSEIQDGSRGGHGKGCGGTENRHWGSGCDRKTRA